MNLLKGFCEKLVGLDLESDLGTLAGQGRAGLGLGCAMCQRFFNSIFNICSRYAKTMMELSPKYGHQLYIV